METPSPSHANSYQIDMTSLLLSRGRRKMKPTRCSQTQRPTLIEKESRYLHQPMSGSQGLMVTGRSWLVETVTGDQTDVELLHRDKCSRLLPCTERFHENVMIEHRYSSPCCRCHSRILATWSTHNNSLMFECQMAKSFEAPSTQIP